MPLNNALEVLNWILGVSMKGTKVFGGGAINERSVKEYLGGKTGWYVVPIGAMSAAATIVQGTISLRRYKDLNAARKAHKGLIKFERFLDVHGMVIATLFALNSAIFPVDTRVACIIAEIETFPFALWRAYKCKQYWATKLEPLSYRIAREPSINVGTELQDLSVAHESENRFSISGFKEFMSKHCPTWTGDIEGDDQTDIHGYLEEYICDCMRKDSNQFWQVLRDSAAYGAETACNVSYLLLVLQSFSYLNMGIYSLIPSAAVFVIAFSLGYRMERINSLLWEMSNSNLLTNPILRKDVHDLLVRFYQKSTSKIKFFAQLAESLKNFLVSFLGIMFMVSAPSINDNKGNDAPDWWAVVAVFLATFFAIYSVRNVSQVQQEMLERTGTRALLEKKKSEIVDEKTEGTLERLESGKSPAAYAQTITTPPKGVKSDAAEQLRLSGGDSPESSASSSVSDSPPESRSLPVNTLIPIANVATRAQSIASEEIREEIRATRSHHKQGWGEWIKAKLTFFGGSSSTQRRDLTQELLSPTDRTDESQPAGATAGI